MKLVKFLCIFILALISKLALSQPINLETVTFSLVPKENGVVLLNYNQPTTMRVNFTVSRLTTGTWPTLPIRGEIRLSYYNRINNTENIIDVINVSKSDWFDQQSVISNVVSKDITIPAGVVNLANPDLKVFAYWRFYKEGYPNPYNTNGWTDWMDKGYQPMKLNPNTLPGTSFTGPSQICDEGTYTISNPGTITLENAAGAATLTALGNNQWKVTRTTQSAKNVILRSTYNGKVYDYPIKVGADKHAGSFMKPPMIGAGVYTIRFNDSQNDFDMNSITWSVRSTTNNVSLRNNTGNIVNVEVLNWNNSGQNNIILTFNAISSCGEAITRDIAIGPGSDIFNPDA